MTRAQAEEPAADEAATKDERDPVLTLSTQVEPALVVDIDGTEFDLLTMEHLSMKDETKLRSLIAQEERVTEQLEHTPAEQEQQLEGYASRLQEIRVSTILLMTTIPENVVRELPTFSQQKLVELIGGR